MLRREFVRRLLALGESVGPLPLYGSDEWEQLPADDPRRFASVVRAAEAWRRDGEPDAIRARLLDELDVCDLLARWRVRMAGHDVRGDTDWVRVHDVVMARREGYQPNAVA
ncbi:MAG TPA: hypothetical protein VFH23_07480 [Jiangellaceae bacterium]|nr:hypothetical protein [Jiangellaceae bacterium]